MKTVNVVNFYNGSCLSSSQVEELGEKYENYDYSMTDGGSGTRVVLMTREELIDYAKEWACDNCVENLDEVSLWVHRDKEGNVTEFALDDDRCLEEFSWSSHYHIRALR